ncbi:MbtH family protein [Streptomyces sp. NC-S4]
MSSREERYVTVVNHEEQYSIWFADRALPAGWTAVGGEGTRQECLARIEEVWTDLTPRSARVAPSPSGAGVPAR